MADRAERCGTSWPGLTSSIGALHSAEIRAALRIACWALLGCPKQPFHWIFCVGSCIGSSLLALVHSCTYSLTLRRPIHGMQNVCSNTGCLPHCIALSGC